MKNLIVIGHPDKQSFCYNGIFSTIKSEIDASGQEMEIIDLYRDSFTRPRTDVIDRYKKLVTWAEWIYIVSPVWWFRLTPRTEIFFDEVFTPDFAYQFINITKTYAYPKPFLKDKKIRTYVTHGAPSLPVRTLYLNSVKLDSLWVFTVLCSVGGGHCGSKPNSFGRSLLFLLKNGKNTCAWSKKIFKET